MKYRIVKNGLEQYFIQQKEGFFSIWDNVTCEYYNSFEATKVELDKMMNEAKVSRLQNQIMVIQEFNA